MIFDQPCTILNTNKAQVIVMSSSQRNPSASEIIQEFETLMELWKTKKQDYDRDNKSDSAILELDAIQTTIRKFMVKHAEILQTHYNVSALSETAKFHLTILNHYRNVYDIYPEHMIPPSYPLVDTDALFK